MNKNETLRLAEEMRRDPLRFERYRVGAGAPLFHADTSREKLLRAGNQWGKTRAGARECLYIMTGCHPWREVKKPPVRGRVVTYSWAQSVEVQRRINEILPSFLVDGYDFNMVRGFINAKLRLKNGSLLEIMTASQGSLAHGAASLDYVWVDEPPPRDLYSELLARLLVKKGTLFLTMTPVGRPVDWLIDEIEEGRLSDHRFDLTPENCPHLDQEQIDAIGEKYLVSERAQRCHGHWHGVTVGRFFEAFSQEAVTEEIPRGECRIALGIDHGEGVGKECCLLMLYIDDPDGKFSRVWIIDEYINKKRTDPDEDAAGILAMLNRHDIRPQEIDLAVGDINSAGKFAGGIKVNDALSDAIQRQTKAKFPPVVIRSARKGRGSVMYGSRLINYAFRRGDLTIHPRCKNLIHSFRHFKGQEEDLKHTLDAARYAISSILSNKKGYFRLRFDSTGESLSHAR